MTCLKTGAGKLWAWQRRAKPCPIRFLNILPIDSDENVGDFAPTGSTIILF